jgi:uncharacterized repeat protein (TIGR03803 family)
MKLFLLFLALCLSMESQNADAATYRLVHAFTGGKNDGRTPTFESSLTVSGPYLYGMTQDGGQSSNGVLFQIQTDGTGLKLVHTFNGWAVLNPAGSKEDGAYPVGTPVLSGSTLYGMTEEGGSGDGLGYGLGTVFSVNTDGSGFQVLHSFGALNDGYAPQGSLILSGSTLYGMTEAGGTNGISAGIIFSIGTNGSGYQILHSFISDGGAPKGSLILWGSTLYGMTAGEIFLINTDGSGYLPVHVFAGTPADGSQAYGSLTRSGAYLYGMTSTGGANNVGTVFQLNLIGSRFQILHSFALNEAWGPYGDLALSGSTLYGMTYGGVTNYDHIGSVGSGAVFQINTNGSGYQVMHTFEFPIISDDGSLPFGTPIVLGSELYGMTSLGGSTGLPLGSKDGGCIFALSLAGSSGSGGSGAPAITTASPLPTGDLDVAYRQQLEASGGETPYTWAVTAGHLPRGLALSASGILSGKPAAGGTADFTIKVTGHDKLSSTQPFSLAIDSPPKLTITTPKSGQKLTAATFNVSGTASGSAALAGVYFQLNGGAWTKAESGDGFAAWNCPNLPLAADTNIFSAYAIDTSGNYSVTNTVKFIYFVTVPLTVTTTGSGSFTPDDNGKKLQVGAAFAITAKAARGFVFKNWTDGMGGVLSDEAALKFVMASNLTLVANFVAAAGPALARSTGETLRPFPAMAGNYRALFVPAAAATNAGSITLALTSSGSFSGKVLFGPDALPFTGNFDSGVTQLRMARRGKSDLTAALQLDVAPQTLTGEVTDGEFVAQITAYRNVFRSSDPEQKHQRTYSVIIPVMNDRAARRDAGYGTVSVDASGNVTFAGVLPDGTKVSQTNLISPDGLWPLYRQLDGGNGSFWAWSEFTNQAAHWPVASAGNSSDRVSGTMSVRIIGGRDAANQR